MIHSGWKTLNKEERIERLKKIEKYYLEEPDITVADCVRRFVYPGHKIISKYLKENNTFHKEGRMTSEELRRALGNPRDKPWGIDRI